MDQMKETSLLWANWFMGGFCVPVVAPGLRRGISDDRIRWWAVAAASTIPLPDGTALDPERLRFEALAEAFGLSAADYGRQFSTGRETFRIVGIDPRRPKYPVSAERIPDGQGFKFTPEQVALLLQKGMRDVTPKGQR